MSSTRTVDKGSRDPTRPRIGAGVCLVLAGLFTNVAMLETYVVLDGEISRPGLVWGLQGSLILAGLWLMVSRRRPREFAREASARDFVLASMAVVVASTATLALAEGFIRFIAGPEYALTGDLRNEYIWRRDQADSATKTPGHTHDRYDPELGWRPVEAHACDLDGGLVTNSMGIRDSREYTFDRVTGVRRIITVGDSYTWGAGVRNEDTYSAALERLLGGVEVINLGVVGWGTDQQYLHLQRLGLKFHPDLVIVGFFEHDYERNGLSFYAYAKPRFELARGGLTLTNSPVPPPGELQIRPFSLPRLLLPAYVAGMLDRILDDTRLRPVEDRPTWTVTREILDAMRQAALDSGAEFLLMYIPYPRRHASAVERALGQWARQTGTHLVTMRDEFRRLSDAEFEAVHQPHHWSSRGHQIAAEAIRNHVTDRKLLD